jgi:hypothetical protein
LCYMAAISTCIIGEGIMLKKCVNLIYYTDVSIPAEAGIVI